MWAKLDRNNLKLHSRKKTSKSSQETDVFICLSVARHVKRQSWPLQKCLILSPQHSDNRSTFDIWPTVYRSSLGWTNREYMFGVHPFLANLAFRAWSSGKKAISRWGRVDGKHVYRRVVYIRSERTEAKHRPGWRASFVFDFWWKLSELWHTHTLSEEGGGI